MHKPQSSLPNTIHSPKKTLGGPQDPNTLGDVSELKSSTRNKPHTTGPIDSFGSGKKTNRLTYSGVNQGRASPPTGGSKVSTDGPNNTLKKYYSIRS